MEVSTTRLAAAQRFGLVLFISGILVILTGLFFAPSRIFPSYLMGFLFWMGLTLGCFPVLMIYHLVGGSWGVPIRRFLEAGVSTLPLMALLSVPLLFGLGYLYRWAQPAALAADPILQRKESYLNLPGFLLRMLVFFAIWGILAILLLRRSRPGRWDDPESLIALRKISAPGLVLFGLATSFAYVDWVMALEPDWYSSIFPVIILMGQILAALAFSIVLSRSIDSGRSMTAEELNQLGDLLLAFVMLWAYMSFAQIIIIYAGNLPHEIIWYLHRMRGGWLIVSWALALFAFGVPFFLLLFRRIKRSPTWLYGLAVGLLVAQAICVFWYVAPSFRSSMSIDWIDPFSFLGVGGAWIAVVAYRLTRMASDRVPKERVV
ncbi:MAG TPA: hypothetical protein VHS80_16855 [Chthoniobacterales bacterium]|nr:hypothetical protein [Chthoniobacterales bacterium]